MANLTCKELEALEEQVKSEKLMVKKFQTMAHMCTDNAIKTKCEEIAQKHNEHATKLMKHLN